MRALDAWQKGEKVVVFCHYVATGRVLRQVISGFMRDEIARRGAQKLGCAPNRAAAELERIGKRWSAIAPVLLGVLSSTSVFLTRWGPKSDAAATGRPVLSGAID